MRTKRDHGFLSSIDIKKSMNLRTSVTDCKEGKVHRFQFVLASSRRSGSWGAARKTAREKIKKSTSSRGAFFQIFFRVFFRAAPQLAERLEEAKFVLLNDVAVLVGRGRRTIHLFCN